MSAPSAQAIAKRTQQVDFGKNTVGYANYVRLVPKHARQKGIEDIYPTTPDPTRPLSKRRFDGVVRAWRRRLHKWDTSDPREGHEGAAAHARALEQRQQARARAERAKPRAAPEPECRCALGRSGSGGGGGQHAQADIYGYFQHDPLL